MTKITIVAVAILVSGCALTPTQKKVATFTAAVLVAGAIAAHQSGGNSAAAPGPVGPPPSCTPQPNGTCR